MNLIYKKNSAPEHFCFNCEQETFLRCGKLPENIRLCNIDVYHELITMLDGIPKEYRKDMKIVIMRKDRNANEWYAWLCKTHIAVDTCNDCNINDLKFADVLNFLSYYEIQSEIRYDYFLDCD